MIRAHVVIFADLGQHHQTFMCHWDTRQDGTLCSQTQAKVVAYPISRVYTFRSFRLFRKEKRLTRKRGGCTSIIRLPELLALRWQLHPGRLHVITQLLQCSSLVGNSVLLCRLHLRIAAIKT